MDGNGIHWHIEASYSGIIGVAMMTIMTIMTYDDYSHYSVNNNTIHY